MDHWYVQLAFALLLEYLGNPALEQRPRRLVLKGARLPGAARRGAPMPADIRIPLDEDGAMLLDWPLTAYNESYAHVSFARFSYLEEYYAHIEEYLYGLAPVKHLFPALSEGAAAILGLLAEAEGARERALENVSDEDFEQYVGLREEGLRAAEELLAAAPAYIQGELAARSGRPGYAAVLEEAAYCGTLVEYLGTELNHIKETQNYLKTALGGKFCILGRVDTGTTDIGVNPFHGEYVNVGTHAVVLDTILSQSFITILPSLWSVIAAFLLVPLLITGIGGFKPVFRISLGISGVVLFTGASLALFALGGVFLGPLGPALAMVSALIIRESIAFAGTEREKQFIRKAFSTYLSGDVVEELLNDPAKLSLGGQTRRMSALFTDVRGFSTISEKLSDLYGPQGGAEALVRLLNDYLSAMSTIVLEQRGTIDKYEGDAIIAFFGAPLEVADHALRACVSAVMMKRLEGELNRKYAETGMSPAPLYTRIGINTGPMVVGNMGTQRKMDYTIMGNAVNLAARLEGVNKLYGSWILASEDTVKAAAGKILSRRLDRVRVVGIHEPVRLYEVLEIAAEAPKRMMEMAALFHKALEIFESRNWTAAAVVFEEVLNHSPEDGPAKVYLERCGLYRNKPPEKDWDGVIALERK
jgi:adenylate cyclase